MLATPLTVSIMYPPVVMLAAPLTVLSIRYPPVVYVSSYNEVLNNRFNVAIKFNGALMNLKTALVLTTS
jgi:hypothetical protein